jgi:hypothetical protein
MLFLDVMTVVYYISTKVSVKSVYEIHCVIIFMFYAPETVWLLLLIAPTFFFVPGTNISENISFMLCRLEADFIIQLVTIVKCFRSAINSMRNSLSCRLA